MCDYKFARGGRASWSAQTIGSSTTFRGTSTRGFAQRNATPQSACRLLPGTELAFAQDVKYDNRWIWTRTIGFFSRCRGCKFQHH